VDKNRPNESRANPPLTHQNTRFAEAIEEPKEEHSKEEPTPLKRAGGFDRACARTAKREGNGQASMP
jgi:hypothetical protein